MTMDVEKLRGLVRVLDRELEMGGMAGAGVLVFHKGKEQFRAFRGYADAEEKKPLDENTIYRMYSMTKPLTSAAFMKLYEMGEIDLMAPVHRYLPGFKKQRIAVGDRFEPVPAMRPCLIKDLLGMTAGLVYPKTLSVAERHMDRLFAQVKGEQDAGRGPSTVEFANRMGEQPLEFAPRHQLEIQCLCRCVGCGDRGRQRKIIW